MIIPTTTIHLSGKLIDSRLQKLIDEKVRLFRRLKMRDAPLAEVVGVFMDYELVKNDKDCGGYCNGWRKVIGITEYADSSPWITQGITLSKKQHDKMVMLHELGHSFQFELERFEKSECILSQRAKEEWQAESIAFHLYNRLYEKAFHRLFDAYFSKKDLVWLHNWYGGQIEDDLNLTHAL